MKMKFASDSQASKEINPFSLNCPMAFLLVQPLGGTFDFRHTTQASKNT